MNQIPGGLLIVIEGIDGSGKTTQAALLAQHFGQLGYTCVMSKEPTIRKWGSILRKTAAEGRLTREKEREYFLLDRREHVAEVIAPALAEGHVVILDRYFYSTAAYQSTAAHEVSPIIAANESFAPTPDRLFILDVDPATGIDRIRKRGDLPNAFESEGQLTHARNVFRDISTAYSALIDGNQSVPEIHAEITRLTLIAAQNKIARSHGLTPAGVNATLRLFGGDEIRDEAV